MASLVLNADSRSALFKAGLLLVLVFGLYLRIGAVLHTVIDHPIRADARLYYLYGFNLQMHDAFSRSLPGEEVIPDAFVPPVYPMVLAPFLEFPPSDRMILNIGLFQAVLGTLTILFTFLLFRELGSRTTALLAAVLTAISPHLVSLSVYMLTETVFTFLMVGGLLALTYAFTRRCAGWAVSAGLTLGVAALTRSTLEYFPLFVLLFCGTLALFNRWERGYWRPLLLMVGFALLIIAAWKLRNLVTLGMLGDPTLVISTLHHGMYPNFMFEGRPESLAIPYRFDPRTAEITASLGSVLHEIATRFQAAPWEHLRWYLLGKPVALLSWSMIDGWGDVFVYAPLASPYFYSLPFQATRLAMFHSHTVLMVLGSIGALFVLLKPDVLGLNERQVIAALLISAMVFYFVTLHCVGAPFPRYGVPLRPIMYGLGMLVFGALLTRICEVHKGVENL